MSENCGELIISAEDLARIRAACQQRVAEFVAAGASQNSPIAPGPAQSACEALPVLPSIPFTLTEAERFVAAVSETPANVRRFFQAEEPVVSPQQLESAQDRLEREARAPATLAFSFTSTTPLTGPL
jgi:hypothetical protein